MVESVSEPGILDLKLDAEWPTLAKSQTSTKSFLDLNA